MFLSVQQLCTVALGLSQHIHCDFLCFTNTSTGGIIYKNKNSISAIPGLLGVSPGVGGKQRESPQLSQWPQPYKDRKNYLFWQFIRISPNLWVGFYLRWVALGCSSEPNTPSAWLWCLWEHPQVCSRWLSPQLWEDEEVLCEATGLNKHFTSSTSLPGHVQLQWRKYILTDSSKRWYGPRPSPSAVSFPITGTTASYWLWSS